MRVFITSLLAAVMILFMVPAPANAAHAVGPFKYIRADDDELNAYLKIRGTLNYGVSKSFKVAESVSVSIQPWAAKNSRISCRSTTIDKFKVNVGRIGHVNPATVTKNCSPTGVNFYVNFKNQVIWNSGSVDRCAEIVIWVVKAGQGDKKINYGTLCLPR